MLYAAKCYWPGIAESQLEQLAGTARGSHTDTDLADVSFLGSLLFQADDLVLCLFEAPSAAAVRRASERLGIPCERVMDSTWLGPHAPVLSRRRRK